MRGAQDSNPNLNVRPDANPLLPSHDSNISAQDLEEIFPNL
jgi:hypothetical protein